ncbi:hypothetical protein FQN53_008647 [Emmonsiellopsis sp. PD_33]|nr:hypothetical protein FQN53_008647 [Emmonsiellopsis sp. PD_33]
MNTPQGPSDGSGGNSEGIRNTSEPIPNMKDARMSSREVPWTVTVFESIYAQDKEVFVTFLEFGAACTEEREMFTETLGTKERGFISRLSGNYGDCLLFEMKQRGKNGYFSRFEHKMKEMYEYLRTKDDPSQCGFGVALVDYFSIKIDSRFVLDNFMVDRGFWPLGFHIFRCRNDLTESQEQTAYRNLGMFGEHYRFTSEVKYRVVTVQMEKQVETKGKRILILWARNRCAVDVQTILRDRLIGIEALVQKEYCFGGDYTLQSYHPNYATVP